MLRAARFKQDTLLELRNDNRATGQAVGVLFLCALSYGVGLSLSNARILNDFSADRILVTILVTVISSMIAGLVWSMTTFLVGTKLFKGNTSYWGLMRPLFFSVSPALLFVLISIPADLANPVVTAVVAAWVIIAEVYAIKNAMGFTVQHSMLTFIVGVLTLILIQGFVLSIA